MKKKPNTDDIIERKQNIPNIWNKVGVLWKNTVCD